MMGLDITSKSKLEYRWSYSGLHQIRYMGYLAQEGKAGYTDWHEMQSLKREPDWPFAYAFAAYPNLYWHSDCDGGYTSSGHIAPIHSRGEVELSTGNSKELLSELTDIKNLLEETNNPEVTVHDWNVFNMLHDLVRDVVMNQDGRLEFC